jgi:hypothetical protein
MYLSNGVLHECKQVVGALDAHDWHELIDEGHEVESVVDEGSKSKPILAQSDLPGVELPEIAILVDQAEDERVHSGA